MWISFAISYRRDFSSSMFIRSRAEMNMQLSFIFAIQEYQPSPFYVLDEVDMFLDSVNAEMVAKRVKESSAKAQFIQVSLRKVTLALADHLIGVTRPPTGISKVIMQPDLAEVSRYEEEAKKKQEEAI